MGQGKVCDATGSRVVPKPHGSGAFGGLAHFGRAGTIRFASNHTTKRGRRHALFTTLLWRYAR